MSPKQFASVMVWLCEAYIDYIDRLGAILKTNNCAGGGGCLKGLNQAKIVKISVILFWLLNRTICKHVHRLELQKFSIFVPRIHQLARYKDEIPVFLILDMHVQNKKYGNFAKIKITDFLKILA